MLKLQRGKFAVKTEEELKKATPEHDNLKRVIDLDYMGRTEYEGNTIPILRMLIEYEKEQYKYYPTSTVDANGSPMILFLNPNHLLKELDIALEELSNYYIEHNYSLWEYIKYSNKRKVNDFWWDIDNNIIIFFGEEKIPLIQYFIDSCYQRDGSKEEIGKKLIKCGIKI